MKFKVKVTLSARKTYRYEIEASNQRKAEDAAFDKAIDAFHVTTHSVEDHNEIEVEQQTRDCARCKKEFKLPTESLSLADSEAWAEDDDYCAECGVKILEEEKAGTR